MPHETWFPRSWHQYDCHHIWDFLTAMSMFLISQQIARWTWCVVCYLLNKKAWEHVQCSDSKVMLVTCYTKDECSCQHCICYLYLLATTLQLFCEVIDKLQVKTCCLGSRDTICALSAKNSACSGLCFLRGKTIGPLLLSCAVPCSAAKVSSLWSVTRGITDVPHIPSLLGHRQMKARGLPILAETSRFC